MTERHAYVAPAVRNWRTCDVCGLGANATIHGTSAAHGTVSFEITGAAWHSQFDPTLDVWTSQTAEPYYAGSRKVGRGFSMRYENVPIAVADELEKNLRDVADVYSFGEDRETRAEGRALAEAARRIEYVLMSYRPSDG